MKLSLGSADPCSTKLVAEVARLRRHSEKFRKRLGTSQSSPMPEWAVEEAAAEGKRHAAKGWKPLATHWQEWPLARKAYLACFP